MGAMLRAGFSHWYCLFLLVETNAVEHEIGAV